MTDTPETESWCGWGVGGLEVVPASFARKLERQRDTAIAERDEALEQLSEWSILNAWGGTPEIIHEFIKSLKIFLIKMSQDER
jgi:hypothetical protein